MSLYTGKGDDGTTKVFNTKKGTRISKTSCNVEALGALDELNSFTGWCKARVCTHERLSEYKIQEKYLHEVLHSIQQNLFTIQAEVAGSDKKLLEQKEKEACALIDHIEALLPPITSFLIPGGTEISAMLDVARTQARHAERSIIRAVEKGEVIVSDSSRSYLNRLSSLFYALVRLVNKEGGVDESAPTYS